MRVTVVGRGRVGRAVAGALAAVVDTTLVSHDAPLGDADVTWLCVPDHALGLLATRASPTGVLLHASGGTPAEVLRPHPCVGVLHPLMTFPSGAQPDLRGVGAAIDGDPAARDAARALAAALGMEAFDRPADAGSYHLAAVLASSLLAGLFSEAAAVLAQAGMDEDTARRLLLPLARDALVHTARDGLAAAATGPAARGDHAAVAAHAARLRRVRPTLAGTYEELTRVVAAHLETRRQTDDPLRRGR